MASHTWKELKALPREVWALSISTFINRMGTMALPFLVLYLSRHLHFSAEDAALIVGIYAAGGLLVAPLSGWLCDRVGSSVVILFSLFASAAVLFLYPLAEDYFAVVGITVLWSLVQEVFRPAAFTAISEFTPAPQRKVAFALQRLAINAGMGIGPAVGGFVASWSFPSLFILDGVTTLAGGVIYWFCFRGKILKPRSSTDGSAPEGFFRAARLAFQDSRLVYLFVTLIPVGALFFQHNSTMPLFLVNNLHFDESKYGLLFSLNTFLIVVLEIWLNLKTAHWRHGSVMALGSLLFGVGFGAMAFTTTFPAVALTVVIWTFGEMFLFPAQAAYITEMAPMKRRGTYMGLYSLAFQCTFVIGPLLGAYLLETFGGPTLWLSCLFAGSLSALMFLRIR